LITKREKFLLKKKALEWDGSLDSKEREDFILFTELSSLPEVAAQGRKMLKDS